MTRMYVIALHMHACFDRRTIAIYFVFFFLILQYSKKNAKLFFRNPFILKDAEWKENRADLSPGFTAPKVMSTVSKCGQIDCVLMHDLIYFRQNHCFQSSTMYAAD